MTTQDLYNKLATDPAYALRLVVINNAGAVTNAMMADGLIQGNQSEPELHQKLMELYNAGETGTLQYILAQVPYVAGSELPPGYDEILAGVAPSALRYETGYGTGPPTMEEWSQGTTGNETDTGINWTEVLTTSIEGIITNAPCWFGDCETHVPPPGPPVVVDQPSSGMQTNMYLIIGGVALFIILLVVMLRR